MITQSQWPGMFTYIAKFGVFHKIYSLYLTKRKSFSSLDILNHIQCDQGYAEIKLDTLNYLID